MRKCDMCLYDEGRCGLREAIPCPYIRRGRFLATKRSCGGATKGAHRRFERQANALVKRWHRQELAGR